MAGDWVAGRDTHLDGGGAALLIAALTQQAIGLHIMTRHWHRLHHMQAVAVIET